MIPKSLFIFHKFEAHISLICGEREIRCQLTSIFLFGSLQKYCVAPTRTRQVEILKNFTVSVFRISTLTDKLSILDTAPSIRYIKIASAERGRFELPVPLRTLRFSRPVRSTALPSLPRTNLVKFVRANICILRCFSHKTY